MFSCETCEIFKNTYFEEHLQATAFVSWEWLHLNEVILIKNVLNIEKWEYFKLKKFFK